MSLFYQFQNSSSWLYRALVGVVILSKKFQGKQYEQDCLVSNSKKEYCTAWSRKEHTLLTCTCLSSSLGPYRPQTLTWRWGQQRNTAPRTWPQPLYAAGIYIIWAMLRRLILAKCTVSGIETNLGHIKSNIKKNPWERMKKLLFMIQAF